MRSLEWADEEKNVVVDVSPRLKKKKIEKKKRKKNDKISSRQVCPRRVDQKYAQAHTH